MTMLIAVAGPFMAATPKERQQNFDRLNRAAAEVLKLGHIPVVGLNCALPVIDRVKLHDDYQAITDISLAVVGRCDAMLFVGSSPGADKERELIESLGKPVYTSLDQIPSP
jgi:hypothetical protein